MSLSGGFNAHMTSSDTNLCSANWEVDSQSDAGTVGIVALVLLCSILPLQTIMIVFVVLCGHDCYCYQYYY